MGREMRNYPQDHDNRNALTFCFILRNPPSRKRSPVMRIHSNCSKSSSQSLGFLRSHRSTPRVCISCCFEASFAFSAPHLDLARVPSPSPQNAVPECWKGYYYQVGNAEFSLSSMIHVADAPALIFFLLLFCFLPTAPSRAGVAPLLVSFLFSSPQSSFLF